MQINPSRRGGSGGETGEREEVGSDEKEKEFHKVEDNVNEELRKNKEEEDESQSLEDFLLESFEIGELPQSDYNTLGLIRPEKVNSMSHLYTDYSVFHIHSLRVWKR